MDALPPPTKFRWASVIELMEPHLFSDLAMFGVCIPLFMCFWPLAAVVFVFACIRPLVRLNEGKMLGPCPHCNEQIWINGNIIAVDCPFCQKRIKPKYGHFEPT